MGLACKEDNLSVPIAYHSDWIIAMCFHNTNAYLKKFLILEIILKPTFLSWLDRNSKKCPPENFWNKAKVQMYCDAFQHIVSWLKRISTHRMDPSLLQQIENKSITINRLLSIINCLPYSTLMVPPGAIGELSMSSGTEQQCIPFVKYIPMNICPILLIPFVTTIVFNISHEEVLQIIKNIKENSNFYSPEQYKFTETHFKDIIKLSESNNGLNVSIYAIMCHVKDKIIGYNEDDPERNEDEDDPERNEDEDDPYRYGYQDKYAKIDWRTDQKSILSSDQFNKVGIFNPYLQNTNNLKEGDHPTNELCSKCNRTYSRQD